MITLSKSGNSVTFTFDENSGYLQNGTIDVPVNSLALITDESDMATFRKSASNDIFVSARYEEFGMTKSELESWYKANMVDSITEEEIQDMIDESVSGKVDTSSVVTAVTSASTDSEIPTAKAVYDAIPSATTYSAGRGIDITNDIVSFSLPISAGTGANSVIEGSPLNVASGQESHAEGHNTTASVLYSHAEGVQTVAKGRYSHAEGQATTANTESTHTEGYKAYGNGYCSHAEGSNTNTNGQYSHAEGYYTKTNNESEHASGAYNVSNTGSTTSAQTLFSVGNGTSNSARHNAFEIRKNGDIYLSLNGQDVKLQDQLGGGEVSSAITSGDTNAVAGGAVYDKFDEVEQVTARALVDVNEKFGGLKLEKLTQAQYDALSGSTDSNTLYVIVN